ncbi:hypothetical protein ABIA44_003463 [Bradyrhizobium sp. USDA 329]
MAAPQRADGTAGAGVQEVHRQQGREDHGDPDRVIDRARREHLERADRQRWDRRDAVVTTQELQLAEEIEQPEPPGERAERQIMAGEADGDQPEQNRQRSADHERQRQRQPRRQAVGRRQHRGGVGAEADEGRLSEGGQAADPGQQHEAHRDQRRKTDIVEQHDPERRHARDERDCRHESCEDEDGKPALHLGVSPSLPRPRVRRASAAAARGSAA